MYYYWAIPGQYVYWNKSCDQYPNVYVGWIKDGRYFDGYFKWTIIPSQYSYWYSTTDSTWKIKKYIKFNYITSPNFSPVAKFFYHETDYNDWGILYSIVIPTVKTYSSRYYWSVYCEYWNTTYYKNIYHQEIGYYYRYQPSAYTYSKSNSGSYLTQYSGRTYRYSNVYS